MFWKYPVGPSGEFKARTRTNGTPPYNLVRMLWGVRVWLVLFRARFALVRVCYESGTGSPPFTSATSSLKRGQQLTPEGFVRVRSPNQRDQQLQARSAASPLPKYV